MPQAVRDEYADDWSIPAAALVQTVTVGEASASKATNEAGIVTAKVVGKSANGVDTFAFIIHGHWRMLNGVLTVFSLGSAISAVPLSLTGLVVALVADNSTEGASMINVRLTTILNGPALTGATQINTLQTQT